MAKTAVAAEVPGSVWQILVAPGDTVEEFQELFLVESMKMEIPVLAPKAGRVVEILVKEGEVIAAEQTIGWID